MGHSWGGFATCNVIHYHKDIKKIVALAPFVSVGKVVGQSIPKGFKIIIPFVVLADYIKNGSYSFRNSIKSLKSFKGDALILHSKNDFMVKYEANTVPLMRECKNAKFLISENKYHNPDYSDDALKIMVNFYKEIKGKTAEEANEIKKRTDFIAMGKLDDEVMNSIISFLNE